MKHNSTLIISIFFIFMNILLFSENKIKKIKITTDKSADCSSLQSIIDSITKNCKTNDEKAIAVQNFMTLTHYHRAYPREKGKIAALKIINTYGWSLCGGLHTIQASIWRQLGWKWRYVGWSNPGHTTTEAYYDNQWHYLDSFLKFYAWKIDPNLPNGKTIASQADLKANSNFYLESFVYDKARGISYLKDNQYKIINGKANWTAPAFLTCGDKLSGIIKGVNNNHVNGSPTNWAGIKFNEEAYSTDINLGLGFSLNLLWGKIEGAHWWFKDRKKVPNHTCGSKDIRNDPVSGPINEPYFKIDKARGRSFASGQLVYQSDFSKPRCIDSFKEIKNLKLSKGKFIKQNPSQAAYLILEMASPYVMSRAYGKEGGLKNIKVSTNKGKFYKDASYSDFSNLVGGHYNCWIKIPVEKELSTLKIEILVQHNRSALPFLAPGENTITVEVNNPQDLNENKLVITYAYQKGSRRKAFEQMVDTGHEISKAHFAKWEEQVTVVQKSFLKSDISNGKVQFKIDVPTPDNKYPVYPKMVFLRREVLGKSQSPKALPTNYIEVETPEGYSLKSLPNPFMVGITQAPIEIIRPSKVQKQNQVYSHVVSKKGEVAENHFIKWKKGETWVALIKAINTDFPSADNFYKARLVLPIIKSRSKAKTKVAILALTEPIIEKTKYDFSKFGKQIGSFIIPPQPATGDYNPPKEFKVDISKAIKTALRNGKEFYGFAIKTVPDRSIDNGYTVRADISNESPTYIEFDVYTDLK